MARSASGLIFHNAGTGIAEGAAHWISLLMLPYLYLLGLSDKLLEADTDLLYLMAWAAFLIMLLLDRRRPAWILRGPDLLIAAAVISAPLVCLGTNWMNGGDNLVSFLTREGYGVLCLLILLYEYQYHREDFRVSLRLLSFILWITVVVGLLTYFAPLEWFSGWDTSSWSRFSSGNRLKLPYGHAIWAAHSWLMGLWLPLTGSRWKDLLMKSLYLVGIFFTQSRSSWVALAVTFVLYLFHMRKPITAALKRQKLWTKILAGVLLLICLVGFLQLPVVRNILVKRLIGVTGTEPFTVRTSHAAYVLEDYLQLDWVKCLFGSGYNSVQQIIEDSYLSTLSDYIIVDNSYFSLLYEYGLITVAAMALVLWKAMKLFFGTKETGRILENASLALIGGFVVIFFYDVQYLLAQSMLMMAAAAVVIIEYRDRKEAVPKDTGIETADEDET